MKVENLFRLALFLLLCHNLHADAIVINLATKMAATETLVKGNLQVTNAGNKTAFRLIPKIECLGEVTKFSPMDKLAPGEAFSFDFSFKMKPGFSGAIPAYVYVTYSDSNGHDASALDVCVANIGESKDSDLIAKIDRAEIIDGKDSSVAILIKNNGMETRNVNLRVYAPTEVTMELSKDWQGVIKAKDQVKLLCSIKNFCAEPGSVYPYFAVLDYKDSSGQTIATVARSTVSASLSSRITANYRWFFIILAILSAIAFFISVSIEILKKDQNTEVAKSGAGNES